MAAAVPSVLGHINSPPNKEYAVADKVTDWIRAAVLVDQNVNALSDRAAVGLPDHYVPPRAEHAHDVIHELSADPHVLVARLTDPELLLERRLAAGTLLALVGDPRLRSAAPAMVDVPAGNALIGTAEADVDGLHRDSERFGVQRGWIAKECPRHELTVRGFRIGMYPVTNAQYGRFLTETRYPELPSSWNYGRFHPALANHPVYTVSPDAADTYVRWLAKGTGRPFRLPTEIEWEYAAAGPEGQRYPWGEKWSADNANTLETGLLASAPVGAFPGGNSWCGVQDMAGNVEEYVSDRYDSYPGGALVRDDLFIRMGHYRIARGGAFNRCRDLARNQRRHGPYPRSLYAMGFRVAEDAVPDDGSR
ncbi:formylglycine-generating enzyme family protein [Streptomyces sp. NPDC060064]|uniref:formylglycine-generating enzyme family protein n=1 Tax=Streptomyces sp. NPDC060064 TaxID=3347049 RepID=UPI0036CA34EE